MTARRIAVLTPYEGDHTFTARHPDDGAKLAMTLGPLRPDWQFETWHVSQGRWPKDLDAFDGYVISGSPASVNDDSAWIHVLENHVRALHAQQRPMVGICFGHQLIAKALGGSVGASPAGLRVGTITSRLDRHAPWMQPSQDVLRLYAAQEEHVTVLPAGALALGGDEVCPITLYIIGNSVFATQCHPEFERNFMQDLLEALPEHMTPAAHAQGCAQILEPVDAKLMRQWIVQFFDQAFAAHPSPSA
jgi:GMP synthase-like glutamine amidotransferase